MRLPSVDEIIDSETLRHASSRERIDAMGIAAIFVLLSIYTVLILASLPANANRAGRWADTYLALMKAKWTVPLLIGVTVVCSSIIFQQRASVPVWGWTVLAVYFGALAVYAGYDVMVGRNRKTAGKT
ncbi:hypothetical protein [Pseudoxanthobacter soli]|nr:hypothetical protein [Pseudoxanthobacter soli]